MPKLKLNSQVRSADKRYMGYLAKLIAFPLFALALSNPLAFASEDEPAICKTAKDLDRKIKDLEITITSQSGEAARGNAAASSTLNAAKIARDQAISRKLDADSSCKARDIKMKEDKKKCDLKDQTLYKWNPKAGTVGKCEDKIAENTKSNPNQGECNNAELFKGSNLRGEACKNAASTIKDVKTRQDALTATTAAAATAYSGMQATQATGQQADAQQRQQKILQALAISKIATGGLQLAGAAQLHSAAGDAEGASSSISAAHKEIAATCEQNKTLSAEQCFYVEAKKKNVPADSQAYVTFDRMKSASSQSMEQAEQAKKMAMASAITGMADTIVGLQALQMSKQAQQNAQAMGVAPGAPPTYRLNGASQGGLTPGLVGSAPAAGPEDFGLPGEGGNTLGIVGGKIGNSIKGGKGFAPSSFKPQKSTVSTTGGGGGGGGGGRGGGSGASRRGGSPTNTTGGEYTLGGGGAGFRGGAENEKADPGNNAFADALAKLFPQDQDGKPVVDNRGLASADETLIEDVYGAESGVYATDLSLFEQVNAKYRQISNSGRL